MIPPPSRRLLSIIKFLALPVGLALVDIGWAAVQAAIADAQHRLSDTQKRLRVAETREALQRRALEDLMAGEVPSSTLGAQLHSEPAGST